jgi:hypothetical protein
MGTNQANKKSAIMKTNKIKKKTPLKFQDKFSNLIITKKELGNLRSSRSLYQEKKTTANGLAYQ